MVVSLIAMTIAVVTFVVLEWQFISLKKKYDIFFQDGKSDSLARHLSKYAADVKDALDKLDQLASFSAKMHRKSLDSIKKVGLVRFNPFGDTGGDQSFCLALLDSHNNGLVISSIHARSGTRFYAKEITGGKPSHVLSDEEQQAYEKAVK